MTNKSAKPKPAGTSPFPLSPLAMFREGVAGFRRQPVLLVGAALVTFGVMAAFRVPAQNALNEGNNAVGLALDIVGAVLAATVAYPWFYYALAAARDEPVSIADPFKTPMRFYAQFGAAFWFWAALIFGVQFLAGVPALLITIFYAFYGFVVVDRHDLGGLKALGTSVRLGQGKRIGLFAIMGLFAIFNFFAFIPVGYGLSPLTLALAVALVSVSTSITMVGGAALYDVLKGELSGG